MYLSCGRIDLAREVFDGIPKPAIFSWNSMIRAYSWNGPFHQALELYYDMRKQGFLPNKFTFPFVLKACSALKTLEHGVVIHRHAESMELDADVFVSTALIDMYIKCGQLDESCKVFRKIPCRDIVAWNSIVSGYSLHGLYDRTIGLILEMQNSGLTPNLSTIVSILPVIAHAKQARQVKTIHGFWARRGMERGDVLVGTALLDAYGKCKCLSYAKKIFDIMPEKNEVTLSAMIGTYVQFDLMEEAMQEFNNVVSQGFQKLTSTALVSIIRAFAKLADLSRGSMIHGYSIKTHFTSDTKVGNTLLSMYTKCDDLDAALVFFDNMNSKDTVSYGAIISGCVQNGKAKEALQLFRKMWMSNVKPDITTMASVVPACSHLAALQHGKCSNSCIIVLGFAKDTSICNALIDMYAKCGRIDYARMVFDRMSDRDLVSWNSLIMGYGIHGLGQEALKVFFNLQISSSNPDDITFICLLSACSHSGLISEGKKWFQSMRKTYNIVPRIEHYVCIIDLLGRGGLLDEAHDFIKQMPSDPDVHVWLALLGACRIHKNIKLAEHVAAQIQLIGPIGTGNFVLLSNIYSAAGRYDEAASIRIVQKEMGYKKIPGCSWIEVKGIIHAFTGADRLHPESAKIYEYLLDLLVEMKKLGYNADTSFVLQNLEEEEKENALLYHSEKIAIAFGIISSDSSDRRPLFVTKNLRVCGDCHNAIKFITLVTKRDISVRDVSRFHHFKDGICNCGDFW